MENVSRKDYLEAADKCVNGKRETDYGSPEDNFANIAKLWSAYKKIDFTPLDVPIMMLLMKIGRIMAGGTEDSFVDAIGYGACAGEIFSKLKLDELLRSIQ